MGCGRRPYDSGPASCHGMSSPFGASLQASAFFGRPFGQGPSSNNVWWKRDFGWRESASQKVQPVGWGRARLGPSWPGMMRIGTQGAERRPPSSRRRRDCGLEAPSWANVGFGSGSLYSFPSLVFCVSCLSRANAPLARSLHRGGSSMLGHLASCSRPRPWHVGGSEPCSGDVDHMPKASDGILSGEHFLGGRTSAKKGANFCVTGMRGHPMHSIRLQPSVCTAPAEARPFCPSPIAQEATYHSGEADPVQSQTFQSCMACFMREL